VTTLALDEKGNKIVMPMRYHMRPHDKDESFDREFNGCYNARFDNLSRVAWWKEALGRRHGIIVVRRFFENVDPTVYAKKNKLAKEDKEKSNLVLCFEPEDGQEMIIPVIWDVWKKKGHPTLISGALITDDPVPEIAAAGHDRTPIFLKESVVDSWLAAKGDSKDIKAILMERERPHYSHRVVGAA
jgi:putative SOS response-associated peptidase YedK